MSEYPIPNSQFPNQNQCTDCDWSLSLSSAFLVLQEICDGPFYVEKADLVSNNGSSLFFSFRGKKLITYKKQGKEFASFIKHYGNENDCKKVVSELNQSRYGTTYPNQPPSNSFSNGLLLQQLSSQRTINVPFNFASSLY
ncbi:uncharacterized protein LOC128388656 [Panonychus citri]|uniref:uncharacterized protein LOC128388656 n=1 Tax=Panonychus citri TaxID=50023 RepID=UPI002307D39D|nr:uncharacterized protein LOC128388656 [Panonychus citri]